MAYFIKYANLVLLYKYDTLYQKYALFYNKVASKSPDHHMYGYAHVHVLQNGYWLSGFYLGNYLGGEACCIRGSGGAC